MNNYFPSDYEEFIYTSRYARWNDELGRREYWNETVERYLDYIFSKLPIKLNSEWVAPKINESLYQELYNAILNFEVMPSMRALMSAGKALERDNTAGYNCSYLPVDDIKSFDEAMYILMCGTGVGFSVEQKYVDKLPEIPDLLFESDTTIVVKDSKEGWAKAFRQIMSLLYAGEIPKWDTSKLREAGARLKIFGGRASGPLPLIDLFNFLVKTFKNAKGRKLTSLECHDIMCKIGEIVVVGGVRRSAMISLSNINDNDMRYAKSGQWYVNNKQRALANNSVVYDSKPNSETFLREWTALVESKSGERGIFNREACHAQSLKIGRDPNYDWGSNPCNEIILRPYQFCNLTEVVIRATDTIEDFHRKVRLATILGTFQSLLTNFPYLRKIWQQNTEEERLLGVSLTGIMDNKILNGTSGQYGPNIGTILSNMNKVAKDTNIEWAELLGIPVSAARTCVKPSGTVSQKVNSSSGIHTRHSPYYIRTVRNDKKDPITKFMMDRNIPYEDDVMNPDATVVFAFPMKSPSGAITRNDLGAIEQLELWAKYQKYWCDHKPSITVSVKDDEWIEVGNWVYNHFDEVSGISFLPFSDHTYRQAPYQDVDEDTYNTLLAAMPSKIDWSELSNYEQEDNTVAMQVLSCTGNACELPDYSN